MISMQNKGFLKIGFIILIAEQIWGNGLELSGIKHVRIMPVLGKYYQFSSSPFSHALRTISRRLGLESV